MQIEGSEIDPTIFVTITLGELLIHGTVIFYNPSITLSWDVDAGAESGFIQCSRGGSGGDPTFYVTITQGEWIIQGTVSLCNPAVTLSWDVDAASGTGQITCSRTGDGISTVSGNITKIGSNGWTIHIGGFQLNRDAVSLVWSIDAGAGSGFIQYSRDGSGADPIFVVTITTGEWIIQGTVTLRNSAINISWGNINIGSGTGQISYSRTGSGISTVSGSITKTGSEGWTMQIGGFQLKRNSVSLSWNVDIVQREGYIHFYQNGTSEAIILTITFMHNNWTVEDTLLLQSNHHFFIEWKLPTATNPSAFFNLGCDTTASFSNIISIKQGSTEVLRIEGELQIENSFSFWWNYNSTNDPVNFYISGNPRKAIGFLVKVNYNNFDFVIQTSLSLLQPIGSISFHFNKPITVTFNQQKPYYRINLTLSVSANRQISAQWKMMEGTFNDPGYFLINIGGPNGCSNLNIKLVFDPNGNYNYQYGFKTDIYGSFHTGGSNWGWKWWVGEYGFPWWIRVGNLYGDFGIMYIDLLFNGVWYNII